MKTLAVALLWAASFSGGWLAGTSDAESRGTEVRVRIKRTCVSCKDGEKICCAVGEEPCLHVGQRCVCDCEKRSCGCG